MVEEMDEKVEELGRYAQNENTEIGEACTSLCELWHNREYLNAEFRTALDKEIEIFLKDFRENWEYVDKTDAHVRSWKVLRWKGNR